MTRSASQHRHRALPLVLLGLTLTLTLTLALSGCAPPPAPASLVVAESHLPTFGLLYIADREGYFRDEGLAVTFQRHTSGRDALAAVVAGQADVGTPYDAPVVIAIQQGRPIRVLSTLAIASGTIAVMARIDRGITDPAQLRGKRIATVVDTSADYLLSLVLSSAGVARAEVQRVALTPAETAEALIQGRVDAAATWEPYTQRVESVLGSAAVKAFTSPLYQETITLSTIEPVLQARPEALKRLLRALLRAQELALREPERALLDVIATLDDLPPAVVRAAWLKLQPQVRLDHRLLATLSGELKWYAALQSDPTATATATAEATDLRPYLATELLRSIQPLAVTLPPIP